MSIDELIEQLIDVRDRFKPLPVPIYVNVEQADEDDDSPFELDEVLYANGKVTLMVNNYG